MNANGGTDIDSYTLDDLVREYDISPDKMEAARNRVDEYIQTYELKKARKADKTIPSGTSPHAWVYAKKASMPGPRIGLSVNADILTIPFNCRDVTYGIKSAIILVEC